MKRIILPLLVLALAGCVKPVEDVQIDPNRAYNIKYKTDDQVVKTRVSNDTLRLDFYQKVNFLLDPKERANTWALHLIQDFSRSYLNNLHFDAIANGAGYAHDWVPINLNDVAEGQVSTTKVTFEGKQYVQISLNRVFEFYNVLGHQAAVNQQNALLQNTNDYVTYRAFYSYNNVYSLSNDANFRIVYTK